MKTLKRVEQGYTYEGTTELTVMICPWKGCHITYAIPEHLRADAQRAGNGKISWYCPNGHSVTYNAMSEEAQLRERLEHERACGARVVAQRDQALAEARGQKAAKTRIKNQRDRERARVGRGVCPCCNRTFQNVQRHMASQHPEHHQDRGE